MQQIWGLFYQCEEWACTLHIILLCAHFSQNVRYWYEICDVFVPIFSRAVRNWYQFFTVWNLRSVKFAVQHSLLRQNRSSVKDIFLFQPVTPQYIWAAPWENVSSGYIWPLWDSVIFRQVIIWRVNSFVFDQNIQIIRKDIGIWTLDGLTLILELTLRDVTMGHSQRCEVFTPLYILPSLLLTWNWVTTKLTPTDAGKTK